MPADRAGLRTPQGAADCFNQGFNTLLQQGLKPRWRKGVEIEFFSAGWIQHDFEYFGG